MIADSQPLNVEPSPWPHRLAIVLCCATFPLVWVGGLVTTYKAGMAFPDWPTSDGYFLFFYPWLDWLRGPLELFVEHGHRMLAALVGLLTIALCVSLWVTKQPRWLRGLGVAALAAVIFQGLLGGARVLLDERTLAMIHGCFGPIFFSMTAILVATTSTAWKRMESVPTSRTLLAISAVTPIAVYLQLVLGAHLRHFAPDGSRVGYGIIVLFHVVFAIALAAFILGISIALWRNANVPKSIRLLGVMLPVLILLQVVLGGATWIYKYNWPAFMANSEVASAFTVHAMGWRQAQITTAHVAVGSLLLAVSSVQSVLCLRLIRAAGPARKNASRNTVFRRSGQPFVEATA
jgi:heme a synthase